MTRVSSGLMADRLVDADAQHAAAFGRGPGGAEGSGSAEGETTGAGKEKTAA